MATLEKSDQYTAGHSKAVAIYARDIAERMGLTADVQERAYLCGLVHDIGKVGLPASLLLKDGPSDTRKSDGRCRSTRRSARAS